MKNTFLLLFTFSLLIGQQEYLINNHTTSVQRDPHAGRDALGNHAVVWSSKNQVSSISAEDIYIQKFNADRTVDGGEVLVNDITDGDQIKPCIAMNGNGDFIIAWASFSDFNSIYDIKAKFFKNGVAIGNEFRVNTTTEHSQTNPECAIDENGNFNIVWESWYQDGSNKGVYCQKFDNSTNKIDSEVLVNTTTKNSQARPSIKFFPDGRFIVIWESWKQDITTPSGYGMFGQLFANDCEKIGGEFQLNTYTNDYQWYGDIEIISNNEFAAVWCSWEQDGDFGGIYFQRFDSTGSKLRSEILVNSQTVWYQWLPKIKKLETGDLAILWSSFKQDGSREGVYYRLLKPTGEPLTLETQINDYTDSFQWEPDFIINEENNFTAFWSSWGQFNNDYEIIGKYITPTIPAGRIHPGTYEHIGRSSTEITVHVMDSTLATGDRYEVSFEVFNNDSVLSTIKNVNTSTIVVEDFSLSQGKGVHYLTPQFEGVAVEYSPEFRLKLDVNSSYFLNQSGTNLQFNLSMPSGGTPNLAPIDIELRWGSADTTTAGLYSNPSDTALSANFTRDVLLPFRAWNSTDGGKVDVLVVEQGATINNRWDPGEQIYLMTPEPYKITDIDSHAQIDIAKPAGAVQMPGPGDVNYIFTIRPITNDDKYYFESNLAELFIKDDKRNNLLNKFRLEHNYPNPFNASTTIKYKILQQGHVYLAVYNMLGQHIATLFDGIQKPGNYKILFDANDYASGVFFYMLRYDNKTITKKMMLMK